MKILIAERDSFSRRGLEAFAQIGATDAFNLSQAELELKVKGYTVLVVRLGLQVNETVLKADPQLKIVATPTTGLDHIDTVVADQLGITVISLKDEREFLEKVYATAEHTFALLLSLIRKVPPAFEAVKQHQWRRDLYRGYELNGKILGLVGCGRLGSMVARYGLAFGMQVRAYDPYRKTLPDGVQAVNSLAQLLSQSDVISLHVPLNNETQRMISGEQFAQIKQGVWLINTSRGAVIDERALLDALRTHKIAGAALDVIDNEHLLQEKSQHPLVDYACLHQNLIITPHIGGATYESVEKADLFIADKIKEQLTVNHK